ncbi:MAG: hypothetical protein U1E63_13215 [Burkholderiales bacterium]
MMIITVVAEREIIQTEDGRVLGLVHHLTLPMRASTSHTDTMPMESLPSSTTGRRLPLPVQKQHGVHERVEQPDRHLRIDVLADRVIRDRVDALLQFGKRVLNESDLRQVTSVDAPGLHAKADAAWRARSDGCAAAYRRSADRFHHWQRGSR